ncbi:hypothetical protein M4951_24395 [Blastopirellula sp. J2-11]|uniref:hypothetical protein n=1 Tax=Blastopirellula sp. J2-11 TaxID=2943192 RepID=UPI0021C7BB4F|nr:hypothetical protein [Blastopirellula sp. J2-11]UUO06473.1 hypothetical protein M4951_24395 [Blastopirellula sp. J2-11]
MRSTDFARKTLPWIIGVAVTLMSITAAFIGWQAYLVQRYGQQLDGLQNDYGVLINRMAADGTYVIWYSPLAFPPTRPQLAGVQPPPMPPLDDLSKLHPSGGLIPLLRPPVVVMDLPIDLIDQQTTTLPQVGQLQVAGPIRDAEDLEAIFRVFPQLDLLSIDNLPWNNAMQSVLSQHRRKLILNVPIEDAPDTVDETKTVTTGDITLEVKTSRISPVEVYWFSRAPIQPQQPSTEIGATDEVNR